MIKAALCAFAIALSGSVSAMAADKLNVSSSSFAAGATIPVKHTGDGEDSAPALGWSGLPAATASVAVCCIDPDAPSGDWWHWIVYNLPGQTQKLDAALVKSADIKGGGNQGVNDFGKTGYNGPAPPPGKLHHYNFKVYALDSKFKLKAGANKNAFAAAINNHVLAEGQYTGVYKR